MKNSLCSGVLIAFVILALSRSADAQCTVGVYADYLGTVRHSITIDFSSVTFFVVLRVEDVVSAVAYRLDISPASGHQLVITSESYGPSGDGININTADGANVGLGECAVGFGDLPILVTRFDAVVIPDANSPGTTQFFVIRALPNPSADPNAVLYSRCTGQLLPCGQSLEFTLDPEPLPVEAWSWSEVKALY